MINLKGPVKGYSEKKKYIENEVFHNDLKHEIIVFKTPPLSFKDDESLDKRERKARFKVYMSEVKKNINNAIYFTIYDFLQKHIFIKKLEASVSKDVYQPLEMEYITSISVDVGLKFSDRYQKLIEIAPLQPYLNGEAFVPSDPLERDNLEKRLSEYAIKENIVKPFKPRSKNDFMRRN